MTYDAFSHTGRLKTDSRMLKNEWAAMGAFDDEVPVNGETFTDRPKDLCLWDEKKARKRQKLKEWKS